LDKGDTATSAVVLNRRPCHFPEYILARSALGLSMTDCNDSAGRGKRDHQGKWVRKKGCHARRPFGYRGRIHCKPGDSIATGESITKLHTRPDHARGASAGSNDPLPKATRVGAANTSVAASTNADQTTYYPRRRGWRPGLGSGAGCQRASVPGTPAFGQTPTPDDRPRRPAPAPATSIVSTCVARKTLLPSLTRCYHAQIKTGRPLAVFHGDG
jgi:hypothetical protein